MSKKKVVSYPVEMKNECLCNVDISPLRSCFGFDGKPVIAEGGHVAEMTQSLVTVLPPYTHVTLNFVHTSGTKAAYKLPPACLAWPIWNLIFLEPVHLML